MIRRIAIQWALASAAIFLLVCGAGLLISLKIQLVTTGVRVVRFVFAFPVYGMELLPKNIIGIAISSGIYGALLAVVWQFFQHKPIDKKYQGL